MNKAKIQDLLKSLSKLTNLNDKQEVSNQIALEFGLTKDRSVYYCKDFALRFSASEHENFGNTVLSLSTLQKYDEVPFIVVLVMPGRIRCLLANSTLLKKISHSSQELRINNIRGSFNGSDILRELSGISNEDSNLVKLFNIHEVIGFDENLPRLVENTNNIVPSGKSFSPDKDELKNLLLAPERALKFLGSKEYKELNRELDGKVSKFKNEIMLAAMIENVNVRGRVIEYLIAGEDKSLIQEIISALQGDRHGIPAFKTDNQLGDFIKDFNTYLTATDVKTKIMVLSSNPKAYNLDKMLQFLSISNSVFMFYFVGIDKVKIADTVLVSIFEKELLAATILLKHWAGRNSRGVTQFEGSAIHKLILNPSSNIDIPASKAFLKNVLELAD
jgi:hypothetical protein